MPAKKFPATACLMRPDKNLFAQSRKSRQLIVEWSVSKGLTRVATPAASAIFYSGNLIADIGGH
jgi:hypothetical protein